MDPDEYEARLTALNDYRLYRGQVDETDNLPTGIHASIVRWQLIELEDEESETVVSEDDEF